VSNHHSLYSLAEATQQTTIAYVTEDIYLYELMAYAEKCWVHYPTLPCVMSSHSCPG